MDIDDLLKEYAPEFDSKLTKIMHDTAGQAVLKTLHEAFDSTEHARDWYFSISMPLDYQRPYDLCKDNKQKQVIEELGRIIYSHY